MQETFLSPLFCLHRAIAFFNIKIWYEDDVNDVYDHEKFNDDDEDDNDADHADYDENVNDWQGDVSSGQPSFKISRSGLQLMFTMMKMAMMMIMQIMPGEHENDWQGVVSCGHHGLNP